MSVPNDRIPNDRNVEKKSRFRIEKLEERIAPTLAVVEGGGDYRHKGPHHHHHHLKHYPPR